MKKDNGNLIGGIFLAVLLIVCVCIYLFSGNSAADPTTGVDVLKAQGGGYFRSMIGWSVIGLVAAFIGWLLYHIKGRAGYLIIGIIVAIAFITVGVGKGCTDKANDGVTSPAGRVIHQ